MNRRIVTATLLAGTALLGACKKEPPNSLPPDPTPTASTETGNGVGSLDTAALGTQAHFVNATNGQNVIYFDTDKYDIDGVDAAALQTQAAYLQQYDRITVTIEGHADERGTREYNLALGERRATAAKNYLVGLGVPASRVFTVSHGKEKPVALGSNETAWAQNRRAVSVVVN